MENCTTFFTLQRGSDILYGAGANGNSSLGTGVVGGMVVGTLALLFVVPVFYIIFEFLQEKIKERPIDKKKLLQRTVITASLALLFGLVAC